VEADSRRETEVKCIIKLFTIHKQKERSQKMFIKIDQKYPQVFVWT